MSRLRARIATALGGVVLAACLSGCEVAGTVDVLSEESLAVDVTLTGLYRGACTTLTSGLADVEVRRGRDSSGQRFCRVTGTLDPAELRGLTLVPAGEYYVLTVDLDGAAATWPLSDVTLRFPGDVVEASNGTVAGRTVRITDLSDLASGERLRLVALRRAGPQGWVIAAALGVLGGAGVAIAGQRWLAARRPRAEETQQAPAGLAEPDGPGQAWPEPGAPEPVPTEPDFDPEFFAPERTATASAPAAADPAVWAQPPSPEETPIAPPPQPPSHSPQERLEWGPPS